MARRRYRSAARNAIEAEGFERQSNLRGV